MQDFDFEINKSLWPSEDAYKVYLTFSKIVGQIFLSTNQKGSINQKEMAELEEAVGVFLALPETNETLGFGEVLDPLFYFFTTVSMVILMESKYKSFREDNRLDKYRVVSKNENLNEKKHEFIELLKTDNTLTEQVDYAFKIVENCKKTIEQNKKYPTLSEEFIEIIKTSAHSYRLLDNFNSLN